MFLGEAPLFHAIRYTTINDSYFYNENESQKFFTTRTPLLGTFSWNIFYFLGLRDPLSKREKLLLFKELSCFYLDAVRCRIERHNEKILLNQTIKNCSQFLEREIKDRKPKNIVIVGERALYAIKGCKQFLKAFPSPSMNQLMKQTITKPIIVEGINSYFLPIPTWRNQHYIDFFERTFKLLNNLV